MRKLLLTALLTAITAPAMAADEGSINRVPAPLDCSAALRDGSGTVNFNFSSITFYREKGQLLLSLSMTADGKDLYTESTMEFLNQLLVLQGIDKGSRVKIKLDSISPNDSRLEAEKPYQITLKIDGAKGAPIGIQCASGLSL